MSFSTQLTRGTLALPMLALFAVLGLFGNEPADAQTIPAPIEISVQALDRAGCDALPMQAILPSQAPADLGPIAHRRLLLAQKRAAGNAHCRA